MEPVIIIYALLPALTLLYGLIASLLGGRGSAQQIAFGAAGLVFALTAGTTLYMTSILPTPATLFLRLGIAYLLLFGVPGAAVTGVVLLSRQRRRALWARMATIALVFGVSAMLGLFLSYEVFGMVNAAG